MSVRLQDFTDKKERMAAIMNLPKAPYIEGAPESFDPSEAVAVEMHDGAVTNPDAQYPALGTVALSTCICVVAHNPITKATGLVHIVSDGVEEYPSPDSDDSLIHMLNGVKGGMGTELEVRLVGAHIGGEMQNGILNVIMDTLSEYDAVILSADVKGKAGPKDVAVDTARWGEGLVRGSIDMVDFMNDPQAGGMVEMIRQRSAVVDLSNMAEIPAKYSALVYNSSNSDDLDYQPEI